MLALWGLCCGTTVAARSWCGIPEGMSPGSLCRLAQIRRF